MNYLRDTREVCESIFYVSVIVGVFSSKQHYAVRVMLLSAQQALILGIIGAVIGGIMSVIIGYSVVSAMIGNTSYFFRSESMIYIPAGMLIGMIVCIVSGLYPAWRASNMDPIDALRNE